MAYTHLSPEERHYIEVQRKEVVSINKIAKAPGCSQGTISRELECNTGQRGYRHKQAQRVAQKRHQEKPRSVKLTDDIKRRIAHEIRNDWKGMWLDQCSNMLVMNYGKAISIHFRPERVPMPI